MRYLVLCSCGHGLDCHAPSGCTGDGRALCPCPNSPEAALEAAVEQARRHPWGAARVDDKADTA